MEKAIEEKRNTKATRDDNITGDVIKLLGERGLKILTVSLIAHTAKITAKILRRRIEKKIVDLLGEDKFRFRRGKGTRDAIGMVRIIAEQTLEIEEELCVCFID